MRRSVLIGLGVATVVGAVVIATQVGNSGSDVEGAAVTTTIAASPSTTEPGAAGDTPVTTVMIPVPTTSAAPAPEPLPIAAVPAAAPAPPQPSIDESFTGQGLITVAEGGADVALVPGGDVTGRIREGVVLAGYRTSPDGEWIEVYHTCDGIAWVRASEVAATAPAEPREIGNGFSFGDAVLVVDPGHGGPSNIGAVGGGVEEKNINVAIAARLRDRLMAPHSVDWDTGAIVAGDDVPAAALVVVTRSGDSEAADYEAGLQFRARLASVMNADAMVSIHNNAGHDQVIPMVGSDVYYQSQAPVVDASRRLAVLLVEEFRRGFANFQAEWVGTTNTGAKSRLSPRDGESQYYGVLKNSLIPTVIAEGAYMSNPDEVELLQTPEFQQAYADAVYRALIRFVTTDEPGNAPSVDPEVWAGGAGSGDARPDCLFPLQPVEG